ncbi:type IV secretory system conjugative DNA transfer family protein [Fictibacillus enclensis]|uniref:VirD4-like conjugal transfer protein, CD1115 family n=1 Tax=Fictibacillus enclensis TaxID=1017270 RepID=UPI0025A0C608|nr:type IV secretory system conjugative DNA transfer family protein [Fictibacillus enclensis]MDM5335783.1 type IV secretory system conjugative DNA transfer family protein [Fictibacillus enclensis]
MLHILKKKKYLSHSYQYDIEGEGLPDKKNQINRKALLVSGSATLLLFLILNFLIVTFMKISQTIADLKKESPSLIDIFNADLGSQIQVNNAITLSLDIKIYLLFLVIGFLLSAFVYSKINYKSEVEIAYGQKGDSRFTSIEEIQAQYKEIPEKEKEFEGVGGIPISHYKDKYYVDTDTANTCILGVSRSGKGEIVIVPMIDIISRANVKSSMILNDPKGELYAASKDILEKRGYDVQVLNLQDPLQSMSYNPLELVKEAWLQGNEQEAGKRANSISFSLYNDPNAGENAFFNDGAQNAVTAIILALVEYCVKNNCPEKITMYNVAEMLNELGTLYYKENEDDFTEKNALDEFFVNLPQGHVAKKRYGSTSFAGEKTRGSILSTANQGLQPFVDPLFAKMTSKNSIELKQIGFPKSLIGQLDPSIMNERIDLSFHQNNKEKTLIGRHRIKVKAQGMYSLNFNETLNNGDLVLIKYQSDNKNYKVIYQLNFEVEKDEQGNVIYQKKEHCEHLPEYKREVQIKELVNSFPQVKQQLTMRYSDKPTAVFMIIPDYDSSNHTLASIFTKQLYTDLATNCSDTKGKKCFTRTHFIMDEFGNMPPIDDMDQVMTVCLGRNIIFNLVVQSYSQFKRKYGEAAETIKENCQNHIYIMSTNQDTIEELSKKAGHKTLINQSSNESHLDMDNKITKSADQERIITFDRLSQLIEGETLVIRSLHRQDNNRKKVRPFPIFNTRETNMPYRWQFLSHWLDTSKDLNDIDIHSEHSNLELSDLNVNFADFIIHEQTRKRYIQVNQKPEPNKPKVQESPINNEIDEVFRELKGIMERIPFSTNLHGIRDMIVRYHTQKVIPPIEEIEQLEQNTEHRDLVNQIRKLKLMNTKEN